MQLEPSDRRKIDRYLDVTKAALLFGGRVLLMEGIAEALLLPVIAKYHTLKNQPDKLRLFQCTVFVPIDGVDFTPYAALLLSSVNGARIADRVVAITDGDKGLSEDDDDPEDTSEQDVNDEASAVSEGDTSEAGAPIPGVRRKAELDELATSLGASQHLVVVTSTYSLEAELLEAGNSSILEKAYLALHPRSKKKWQKAVALSSDARAKAIHDIFKATRKGDFAQALADLIESGDPFTVPAYLAKAIEEVVAS